ncbi:MAG: hypothetical protein R3C61_03615 [Bacteroidia bacterium]
MKSNFLLIAFLMVTLGLQAQYGGTYTYNDHHSSYRDNDDEYYSPQHNRNQDRIQIALVLDVSGSMDGLIDQARSQLWHIVNGVMMDSEYGYGRGPELEIALYEVGNENLGPRNGYMRQVVPFTRNLDWISEELFYLRTGGRYEYYGDVIMMAMDQLNWSRRNSDLKLMFIAGNEDFDQGRTDFREAIRMATRQGVIVNTIYCGSYQKGISLGWARAAEIGNGDYMNIDHNYHVYYDPTPYDRMFFDLNTRLNNTYIPYGTNGHKFHERQLEQDRNANRYGQGIQSQRTLAKASQSYRNEDWDLIDAVDMGIVRIESINPHDLPAEMRNMTLAQKKDYIARKKADRVKIQSEIRQLGNKSQKESVESRPAVKPSASQGNTIATPRTEETQTFDKAVIQSVKKRQLETTGTPVIRQPAEVKPAPAPVENRKAEPVEMKKTAPSEIKKTESEVREIKKQSVETPATEKPATAKPATVTPGRPAQSAEQVRQRARQF